MDGILVSAIVERIATRKDNTVAVTLGTNELPAMRAGELLGLHGKLAAVYLSPKETLTQSELDQVDAINPEMPGKSRSQRLRGVLFKVWETNNVRGPFEQFYASEMEKVIEEYKKQIIP